MPERTPEAEIDDLLATPEAGGKAIRGGMIRAAGYGLGLAMALVSAPLLTRHLGVVDFGSYVTVLSLATIVALVADAGLTVVGVREYTIRDREGRARLMANILSIRLVIATSGTLLVTAFAFAAGYERSLIAGTALAGLGVVVASILQTFVIPLMAEIRMGMVTALDLLRQGLSVLAILALIVAGAGLLPFFAIPIPVGAVVVVATGIAVHGAVSLKPGVDRVEWRRLLRVTLPVAAASILAALFYRVAIVQMSIVSTEEEIGYFGVSLRVIEVIIPIPSLITSTAFPILVRSAVDAQDRLVYGMQRLFEVGLILGVWCALGLFIGAEPVIQFIGGSEFDPAVSVLQIQSIAIVASFLFAVWAAGLWAIGAQRSLLHATIVGVVSVTVLTAVLASTHGAIGTAIAMTVSEVLLAGVAGVLLMRQRHLRVELGVVLKVAVALGSALLVLVLGLPKIILVALATAVYFTVLAILGGIPPDIRHALVEWRRGKGAQSG